MNKFSTVLAISRLINAKIELSEYTQLNPGATYQYDYGYKLLIDCESNAENDLQEELQNAQEN